MRLEPTWVLVGVLTCAAACAVDVVVRDGALPADGGGGAGEGGSTGGAAPGGAAPGGNDTGFATCQEALAAFQACMTLSDFEQTDAGAIADQVEAGGCASCHEPSHTCLDLPMDRPAQFAFWSTVPCATDWLVVCTLEDGQPRVTKAITLFDSFHGPGQHPGAPLPEEVEIGMHKFVERALARLSQGGCP